MDWLDFSGLDQHLARFRRWLNQQPDRDFTELGVWERSGRLALILIILAALCGPVIWFLTAP
jgi:hypothetical protein